VDLIAVTEGRTMRRQLLIAVGLVVGMRAAAAYGQSMVQRCEALVRSRSADAGWSELCQGIFAANGTHGPQDQAAAFQHYQRAAELGNVEAEALLGAVYERGWAGVPRDLNRAVTWYQKAAQQGHAGAKLNLGLLYEKGEGVPKDPGRARSLIEAAAKQGLPPAQRKLRDRRTYRGPSSGRRARSDTSQVTARRRRNSS
jgi:TPR repeat protein